MKNYSAEIKITLREGILDVQGKTVEHALESMKMGDITGIRIGKFVTLKVEADDSAKAYEIVDKACKELIANPIIEDYKIELKEI